MAKETKEESLDLFYLDKNKLEKKSSNVTRKSNVKNKQKDNSKVKTKTKIKNKSDSKNNGKNKEENTKDESFNFDKEIVIGLKRIDEPKENSNNKKSKDKKTSKKNQELKSNNGVSKNKKTNHLNSKDVKSKDAKYNSQQTQKINKDLKSGQAIVKNVNKKKETKKLTPKQELAKRKRQAIFKIVKWLTLIIIIIGLAIFAILSPIFNVKNIEVTGNSLISEEQIISLSQIEIDQNMFQYHKDDIIKNIKENPYIEAVKVKRKIPDTIQIEIQERQATFKIQFANAYAYINNQGYILEISSKKQELPILVGFETQTEDIQEGNRLCNEDLSKLGDVLKIMESAKSNDIDNLITQIDITDDDDYKLTMQKKNKIVHLGDTSNLSTKMLWIIKFNELEGDTAGEIILNINLNDEKNKPYFRKDI